LNQGVTIVVCPANDATCGTIDPPAMTVGGGNSGINLRSDRYRAGGLYIAGLFYFIGGRANATAVLGTVERGGY
jgi:hypothetical protein